ncbi:hypothetical protein [Solimonas aquatica]|nr:hypothetical protein [Solimonas aquatica]
MRTCYAAPAAARHIGQGGGFNFPLSTASILLYVPALGENVAR